MPGKILGLEIDENHVTAVQVTSGLKGYNVTACCRIPLSNGENLEKALDDIAMQIDMKNDTYLASIPGSEASYRNLQMPFKDPKKISQVLPFEVESMIPFSIDDIVIDFSASSQSIPSDILAVYVKKRNISSYLELLQHKGISPDVLDIHCIPSVTYLLNQEGVAKLGLFVELGLERNTMVLFFQNRIMLVRNFFFKCETSLINPQDASEETSNNMITAEMIESCIEMLCSKIRETIHSFGWQRNTVMEPEKIYFTGIGSQYPATGELLTRFLDIPAVRIDFRRDKRIHMDDEVASVWHPGLMDSALALAIRGNKKGQGFNLRKGEFEVNKDYFGLWKGLRRVSLLLILVLLFFVINISIDYYYLNKRYNFINQKSDELFRQTFPDVKRVQDPVREMKIRIDELNKSSTSLPAIKSEQRTLELLNEISRSISKPHDILMTDMVIDFETIRISGETDTFNTVDSIKNELESSDYFRNITITSSKKDRTGKRVQFEMRIQRIN